ncbi:MAG TPA: hypothetical protein VM864_07830 [Pyrinomonadaceae bacterium]|jgi:hypothetical protein|nr:hypothetical protein [Pyrinomonadaceae bacterium]
MTDERARRADDGAVERERADERGDAAEPNAPTSAEENEGMSTILSADPLDGVQDNEEES